MIGNGIVIDIGIDIVIDIIIDSDNYIATITQKF